MLACLLKPSILRKYSSTIKPEYFERKDEHEVARHVLDYWNAYKIVPDEDDLLDLAGRQYIDLIHSIYLGVVEWDLSYTIDKILLFAQEQAAKIAVLESLDDIEHGDLLTVLERLKQAITIGHDAGDTGLDLKRDVDTWLDREKTARIPTGMIHLDIALNGGLAAGELGIFLAPPNYGKSMALINAGYGAAGPTSGRNVAHFSFEMEANIIAKRYSARTIFRFPRPSDNGAKYKEDFQRIAEFLLPGDIRMFRVSGDVNVVKTHLNTLIDDGFDPGLIIIDYGDEMEPLRHRREHWIELGTVFHSLRELAHEYQCPVWTATQSRRSALGKEVITMADLAESFRKAAIADVIVAICQTAEEEANDQCRLFIAKLRDGKSRSMIRAKFFKEQQAIVTTGFVGGRE